MNGRVNTLRYVFPSIRKPFTPKHQPRLRHTRQDGCVFEPLHLQISDRWRPVRCDMPRLPDLERGAWIAPGRFRCPDARLHGSQSLSASAPAACRLAS